MPSGRKPWSRLKEASLTGKREHVYNSQHRTCVEAIRDRSATDADGHMVEHLQTVRKNMCGSSIPKTNIISTVAE